MKIALIQMTSVLDPEVNLKKMRKFLRKVISQKAKVVFLPEVFYSLSTGDQLTPYIVENKNEHYQAIQKLAQESGVYLLGGSATTREKGQIFNRVYHFSPSGEELPFYDKMNLFKVHLRSGEQTSSLTLDESRTYTAGQKPVLIDVEGVKIGMSLCFDLRFPELYRFYSGQGAQLLSVSSSFTVPTGKAHWHTLLRARAIENQCYVVAAAQWGKHNEKISTYGHSLVVDPWGQVLVDAEEGEKVIFSEISLDLIKEVRTRMQVLKRIPFIH